VTASRVAPDLERVREIVAERGGRLGAPLELREETESTNDDAVRAARGGAPHGATFVAESQRAGRGRQGRAWHSARGENLLFSVVLRPSCPPARVPPLSLVVGLAVRDAVARAIGDDAAALVKWPNDVVVRQPDGSLRKIAGILVESSLVGSRVEHVVVGVGINVHARAFPDSLAGSATSVAIERSSRRGLDEPSRGEILADVLAGLDRDVEHVASRGLGLVHARLLAHDALLDRDLESDDPTLRGVGAGIDPDGRILVRRPDGSILRLASGEVRLRASPGGPALP